MLFKHLLYLKIIVKQLRTVILRQNMHKSRKAQTKNYHCVYVWILLPYVVSIDFWQYKVEVLEIAIELNIF